MKAPNNADFTCDPGSCGWPIIYGMDHGQPVFHGAQDSRVNMLEGLPSVAKPAIAGLDYK